MSRKEFFRTARRAPARYVLYLCTWLARVLPYSAMRALGHVLLKITMVVTRRHQQVARESLAVAFAQEKSSGDREGIIRRCFEKILWNMVEICYFNSHPQFILDRIEMEGQEHLDAALKRGNGVVALTAHFGSFPMMFFYLASKGYAPNVILRSLRDEKAEAHVAKTRDRYGLKTIYALPRNQCITRALRALRGGELLCILGDQNFGSGTGVFVDFFGRPAATAIGPLVFAKRTGAALVPMFIRRVGKDRHVITIQPELELEWTDDGDGDMVRHTQRFTTLIENEIRRYPDEWGWMHRRWKSRPQHSTAPTGKGA